MRNNHPVLALFMSHRLHPIARDERWFITGMQVLFVMILSCLISEAQDCLACNIRSCARNTDCVESLPHDDATYAWLRHERRGDAVKPPDNLCCYASQLGMLWVLDNCVIHVPLVGVLQFGVPLYALVALVIFGQVCFQLGAMCACAQAREAWTRRCCETVGQLLLLAIGIGLIACTPPLVVYVSFNGLFRETLRNFAISKVWSVFGATLFQTLVFSMFWHMQRGTSFHVTEEDWRKLVRSESWNQELDELRLEVTMNLDPRISDEGVRSERSPESWPSRARDEQASLEDGDDASSDGEFPNRAIDFLANSQSAVASMLSFHRCDEKGLSGPAAADSSAELQHMLPTPDESPVNLAEAVDVIPAERFASWRAIHRG